MSFTICPVRHCGAIVPSKLVHGSHRCPKHQRERSALKATGSTRQWRKTRQWKLTQDPICEVEGCTQAATVVDHFTPRAEGGTDDPDNLASMCVSHDRRKTAGHQLRYRARPRSAGMLVTFA
jgi:5-methylcytosine-specific restriction enzyme A